MPLPRRDIHIAPRDESYTDFARRMHAIVEDARRSAAARSVGDEKDPRDAVHYEIDPVLHVYDVGDEIETTGLVYDGCSRLHADGLRRAELWLAERGYTVHMSLYAWHRLRTAATPRPEPTYVMWSDGGSYYRAYEAALPCTQDGGVWVRTSTALCWCSVQRGDTCRLRPEGWTYLPPGQWSDEDWGGLDA